MFFFPQLGQSFASFPESFPESPRGPLSRAGKSRWEPGLPNSRFRLFYGYKTHSLLVLRSSPRLRRLFPVARGHARMESSEPAFRLSAVFPPLSRAGPGSPGAAPGPGAHRRDEPSLGQSRLKEAEIKTKLVKKKIKYIYVFCEVLFSAILSLFLSRLLY